MHKKSIVTEYEQYSAFSGHPSEAIHHLIYGRGGALRKLADEDGLTIGLLHSEHNMSSHGTIHQIHGNPAAEHLSKMAGQLAWEKNFYRKAYNNIVSGEEEDTDDVAREAFRKRYGESFL